MSGSPYFVGAHGVDQGPEHGLSDHDSHPRDLAQQGHTAAGETAAAVTRVLLRPLGGLVQVLGKIVRILGDQVPGLTTGGRVLGVVGPVDEAGVIALFLELLELLEVGHVRPRLCPWAGLDDECTRRCLTAYTPVGMFGRAHLHHQTRREETACNRAV